jgi:hypothetical protein
MFRTRPVAITVVALAVSLPLAACGGGGDDESFKEDYNTAVKPLTEANLGEGGEESNGAVANQLGTLADKTQQARDNLAELDPPNDAKDEFDRLLDLLPQAKDNLSAVANAAKEGDPTAAAKAQKELVETSGEIQEAERALRQAVDG